MFILWSNAPATESALKLTQNLPLQIDSRRQLVNGDWDLSLCGTRSELPVTFKFWIPPCFQASTCWFSSLSSKTFIQKCHAKVRIKAQDLVKSLEIYKVWTWLIQTPYLFVVCGIWSNFPSYAFLFLLPNLSFLISSISFPFLSLWLLFMSFFFFFFWIKLFSVMLESVLSNIHLGFQLSNKPRDFWEKIHAMCLYSQNTPA